MTLPSNCKFHIRAAKDKDPFEMSKVDRSLFGPRAFPIDYFVQGLDIFGEDMFVGTQDGIVAGFGTVAVDKNSDGVGHILTIAVASAYQAKGLGKLLVQYGIHRLKTYGLSTVYLVVSPENDRAISLYSKAGFKQKELLQNYYGVGEDRFLMELGIVH